MTSGPRRDGHRELEANRLELARLQYQLSIASIGATRNASSNKIRSPPHGLAGDSRVVRADVCRRLCARVLAG